MTLEVLRLQWSTSLAGHLGPIRGEVGGGWSTKRKGQKEETDGRERTRDSAGQSDKGTASESKLGEQI